MSDVTKPKINFNEMISVSLNLDNLKKYMDYLEEQNKRHNEQMHDINIKLSRMEYYQHQTDDLCSKMEIFQKKIEEFDNTLTSHSNKFIEIEVKNNEISQKFELVATLEKTVNEHKEILATNEENFNKLSRDVEINGKDIAECTEKVNKIKVEGENSVFATSQSVVDLRDQLRKEFDEEMMYMREEFDKKIIEVNTGIFAREGIKVEPLESEDNLVNNIDKHNPKNVNIIVDNLVSNNVSQNIESLENHDNVNDINTSNSGINDHVNMLNNAENEVRKKSILSNEIINHGHNTHHGHKISTQSNHPGNTPSITESPYKRSSSLALRKEVEILKKEILNLKSSQDNIVNDIKHEIKTAMMRNKRGSVNIQEDGGNSNSFMRGENAGVEDVNTSRKREEFNENTPREGENNINNNNFNNSPFNIRRSNSIFNKDGIVIEIKDDIKEIDDKVKKLEENFRLIRNAINAHNKGDNNALNALNALNTSINDNPLNTSRNQNNHKALELKIESFHIDTEPIPMSSNRSNMRSSLKHKEPTSPAKTAANIGTSLIVQDLLKQNETLTSDIKKLNDAITEVKHLISQVKTEVDSEDDNATFFSKGGKNKRINDLERNVNRLKAMLEDTKGNDDVDSSKEERSLVNNNGGSIKEMIKSNMQNLKVISDRVDKQQSKLDHLTNEIVIKLKKDLSSKKI
jgi:hypothetical protein